MSHRWAGSRITYDDCAVVYPEITLSLPPSPRPWEVEWHPSPLSQPPSPRMPALERYAPPPHAFLGRKPHEQLRSWTPLWARAVSGSGIDVFACNSQGRVLYRDFFGDDFTIFRKDGSSFPVESLNRGPNWEFCDIVPTEGGWTITEVPQPCSQQEHVHQTTIDSEGHVASVLQIPTPLRRYPQELHQSPCGMYGALLTNGRLILFQKNTADEAMSALSSHLPPELANLCCAYVRPTTEAEPFEWHPPWSLCYKEIKWRI